MNYMIPRIYQCCKPRSANQSEILIMSVRYVTTEINKQATSITILLDKPV
jgi:hypothetical protein